MDKMRKFWQLSVRDKALFFKTVAVLAFIRVCLWVLPFRTVKKVVNRLAPEITRQWEWINPNDLRRVAWSVTSGSSLVPGATCLTQALTTQIILRRWGIPSDLVIGVNKTETGQFEAHAWVEYDGQVVVGGIERSRKFMPFAEEVNLFS
jgi:hypothetical protein